MRFKVGEGMTREIYLFIVGIIGLILAPLILIIFGAISFCVAIIEIGNDFNEILKEIFNKVRNKNIKKYCQDCGYRNPTPIDPLIHDYINGKNGTWCQPCRMKRILNG